jgi:hypothetical protein
MVNQLWMLQVKLAEYDTTQTSCKQHGKSATNGALIHCHVLVICVYVIPPWYHAEHQNMNLTFLILTGICRLQVVHVPDPRWFHW